MDCHPYDPSWMYLRNVPELPQGLSLVQPLTLSTRLPSVVPSKVLLLIT